jgi:murein DD-endopeptidase MepM/ murein hydrolase activator NlpD
MLHRWPVPGGKAWGAGSDFLAVREPTKHTQFRTLHGGLDISHGDGRPHLVIAAAPGRVISSTTETTYNPGVIVTAGLAMYQGRPVVLYLCYGHMSPAAVRACPVNRVLMAGVPIGNYASSEEIKSGASRNKTSPDMGSHLHFEVRLTAGGQPGERKRQYHFDPYLFLHLGRLHLGRVLGRKYPLMES